LLILILAYRKHFDDDVSEGLNDLVMKVEENQWQCTTGEDPVLKQVVWYELSKQAQDFNKVAASVIKPSAAKLKISKRIREGWVRHNGASTPEFNIGK
jgi:hypothetical protein